MSAGQTSRRAGRDFENGQRQRLGAWDDRVDSAPFLVGMGIAADRAGTAQGGRAKCSGEAAVGRATGRLARDPKPETRRGPVVKLEQPVTCLVLLERQEIALPQNTRVAPRQFAAAADLAHLAEDLFHDVEGRKTDIDGGGGTCGDRVDRGAALGKPDIDRRAKCRSRSADGAAGSSEPSP